MCASDTRDYRMLTTDAVLRAAVSGPREQLRLTLDPAFQGLPGAAHGGALLALVDARASRTAAREVVGQYLRRVPVGVALVMREEDAGAGCRVLDTAGAVLLEGRVRPAAPPAVVATAPLTDAWSLPVSRGCFACGTDNALGLHAQLAFDAEVVAGAWRVNPRFLREAGRLAPVAVTTLLDEVAFWLGALATGESGMTTELRVTLADDAPVGDVVHVAGARADVRPRADDPRYWDTTVAATGADGRCLASARITFVGVRGAARRLVAGLLEVNRADVVQRVFPAYCA
jgi:hypothetical protein